jgi:glycosyltransferase involved in cell wall biosynthesis
MSDLMSERMRIAVVEHVSAGGVSRFMLALLTHMASLYPDVRIDYFVAETNVARDRLHERFAQGDNVSIVPIRPAFIAATAPVQDPVTRSWLWRAGVSVLKLVPPLRNLARGVYTRARDFVTGAPPPWYRYRLDADVVARLNEYDVVYLGWPYFIEPERFKPPVVATFHDFHFRRFPGDYEKPRLRVVERQTPEWLRRCARAVVSSEFVKDDLRRWYGAIDVPVDVVRLAPYGFQAPDMDAVQAALDRLPVRKPFVLYSGGPSPHKNIEALVRAVRILKDQGHPVQLVITGIGTDLIGVVPRVGGEGLDRALEETALVRGQDYVPLGYVSNEEVDALTAGADAVVHASLYEAGCGPAMDAWQAGVPVAFSAIPPFLEQIEHLGVEAWAFDPYDPSDVADKIRSAVFDRETSLAMAERSKRAIARYTWDDVARGYMAVLEAARRT